VWPDYIESDIRMTDERKIGKDLEGSGCDVMEVLSWHLPGGTKEKHETPQPG
jgi:hypothetical protein